MCIRDSYEANHKGDKQPYLYSRYCDLYRQHMRYSHATMRIPRTPGEQVEVDWSGKTGYLKDPTTGDLKPVYLFVAAMSYSQYCYAEGFLRMDEDAWIRAHVPVSYTHLRAHETPEHLVCRLLL